MTSLSTCTTSRQLPGSLPVQEPRGGAVADCQLSLARGGALVRPGVLLPGLGGTPVQPSRYWMQDGPSGLANPSFLPFASFFRIVYHTQKKQKNCVCPKRLPCYPGTQLAGCLGTGTARFGWERKAPLPLLLLRSGSSSVSSSSTHANYSTIAINALQYIALETPYRYQGRYKFVYGWNLLYNFESTEGPSQLQASYFKAISRRLRVLPSTQAAVPCAGQRSLPCNSKGQAAMPVVFQELPGIKIVLTPVPGPGYSPVAAIAVGTANHNR
eukprot:3936719-Rhodomonas_salina.1